jgi:hypothetical protein
MKLRCPYPQCTETVHMCDRTCPSCGNSLALQPVLRLYAGNLWSTVSGIKCPDCGSAARLTSQVCPNPACHAPLTVDSIANAALKAPRDCWQRFLANATETTAMRTQRFYFLASATLLWCLLSWAENQWTGHWFLYAVLAVAYFFLLGILAPLIAPNVDFQRVWNCAASRVKLGLICNWLSLLLLMQLLIGVWYARAVMLASLVVMGGLAIFVLSGGLSSDQNQEVVFDPSEPQGRRARFE